MSGQFRDERTDEDEILGRPRGGVLLVCPCRTCWRDWDRCDPCVPDDLAMILWVTDDSRRCQRFVRRPLLQPIDQRRPSEPSDEREKSD